MFAHIITNSRFKPTITNTRFTPCITNSKFTPSVTNTSSTPSKTNTASLFYCQKLHWVCNYQGQTAGRLENKVVPC